MKKIKIVALFGPAGSGKDYLLQEIKNSDINNNFNEIISCTTRPRRQGEINGVNYYFISPQNFYNKIDNGEMLEASNFNDWWYGTPLSSLREDKLNIGVFNVEGIRCLLEDSRLEVYPIAISANPKTRMIRQLNREDNPNIKEIFRRFLADEKEFEFIDFKHFTIINEDKSYSIVNLKNTINNLLGQN